MTYEFDCTLSKEFLESILEHGLDALPELMHMVINTAMELEQQQHLGVAPYKRDERRRGYANDYKQKTVATRLGKITFNVPKYEKEGFIPAPWRKKSAASGIEVGIGGDVRARRFDTTRGGDHRTIVWL